MDPSILSTCHSISTFLLAGIPVRVSRAAMISSQVTAAANAHIESHRLRSLPSMPLLMMHEHITAPAPDVHLLAHALTG